MAGGMLILIVAELADSSDPILGLPGSQASTAGDPADKLGALLRIDLSRPFAQVLEGKGIGLQLPAAHMVRFLQVKPVIAGIRMGLQEGIQVPVYIVPQLMEYNELRRQLPIF